MQSHLVISEVPSPPILCDAKHLLERLPPYVVLTTLAADLLFYGIAPGISVYLWKHAELPNGITYSRFVHDGVYNLIATVIFSALVLTAIFQQSIAVTSSRGLKVLAMTWIQGN